MFDKGCSILCIFGLPGSKHDGESAHALQASYAISSKIRKEISNLEYVSIGVTTGPVFVGVMGRVGQYAVLHINIICADICAMCCAVLCRVFETYVLANVLSPLIFAK